VKGERVKYTLHQTFELNESYVCFIHRKYEL